MRSVLTERRLEGRRSPAVALIHDRISRVRRVFIIHNRIEGASASDTLVRVIRRYALGRRRCDRGERNAVVMPRIEHLVSESGPGYACRNVTYYRLSR